MPYPESCPECGGAFRNTGTHFTARRNEVGRHVLLELGCQNTSRRFWWDFTSGNLSEDGRATPARAAGLVGATATNGALHASNGHASNGHVASSTAVAELVVPAVAELAAPEVEAATVSAPTVEAPGIEAP